MSVFTMTDAFNVVHRMLLIRNPWGENYYEWKWSKTDPRWTN